MTLVIVHRTKDRATISLYLVIEMVDIDFVSKKMVSFEWLGS
jgi:hypothetical protein